MKLEARTGSPDVLPPVRLELALVLTPLGRNTTSLPNFYWTPLFEALNAVGISFAIHQPRRVVISLPGRFRRYHYSARRVPLVSPLFLVSLIRTRPSFILSTEYGPHTLLSLMAARVTGAEGLIFKEHSDCAGLSRGRLLYRKLLTRLAKGMIVNTHAARLEAEAILGSNPTHTYPVSLLVPPTADQLTRAKLSVSFTRARPRPVFLFVGRLVRVKKVDALVEASAILSREGRSFSVLIVGEGPELPALAESVSRLNLAGVVSFASSIQYDAIGHIYAACDVLVMPTLRDYRSVAVLEAMRFGMPIIDSCHDGNANDSVLDGVNGFVFEPNDIRGLAEAMRQFIAHPSLIGEMGARSAEFIENLTPLAAAKALRDLLLEIAEARTRSATIESHAERA